MLFITFGQLLYSKVNGGPVGAFNLFSQPVVPIIILLKHSYAGRGLFLMLHKDIDLHFCCLRSKSFPAVCLVSQVLYPSASKCLSLLLFWTQMKNIIWVYQTWQFFSMLSLVIYWMFFSENKVWLFCERFYFYKKKKILIILRNTEKQ